MQPLRGFIPPRVIGRSHLISYERGGLRTKTSGAMFSIRDSTQGKDKDKGNGRDKGKVFGK